MEESNGMTFIRRVALPSGGKSFGILAWVSILIAAFPVVTQSRTWYVDARGGNDAFSGSRPDSAWKSLEAVNGIILGPGDSVLFKGGEAWSGRLWPKGSGLRDRRIVIGAYGQGRPHIDAGGAEETVYLKDMRHVIVEGLEITNRAPAGKTSLRIARGIHVFTEKDSVFPGIILRRNYLHHVAGHTRRDRWRVGAIFARSMAQKGRFDDLLIEDNEVRDCSVRGIFVGDGKSLPGYLHRNVIIRRNRIDGTGLEGILVSDGDGVLIEGNTVYRAGDCTFEDNLDSMVLAGVWCASKDVTIQGNEVAYTRLSNPFPRQLMDSEAFDIDLHAPGTHIIQYNYSHHNEGGFFLFMGNPGPDFKKGIIRYNISHNDGRGFGGRTFELHSHKDNLRFPVHVYNNVIHSDSLVWVNDRSNGKGVHPGFEFRNNIFHAPRGLYADTAFIEYDNNLYFGHAAPQSDLRAKTGDPRLRNPSGGDGMAAADRYKLGAGSTALRAGIAVTDNGGRDFWGNALPTQSASVPGAFPPSSLDIGAHQVTAATTLRSASNSARPYFDPSARLFTIDGRLIRFFRDLPPLCLGRRRTPPSLIKEGGTHLRK